MEEMVTIVVPKGSVIVTAAAAGEVIKAADLQPENKE
jgi:hypothetical protein